MNDFAVMQYAASGMDAQKSALDVLARNVALTESASPGHPVHTLEPQFAVAGEDDDDTGEGDASFSAALASATTSEPGFDDAGMGDGDAAMTQQMPGQVSFAGAQQSARAVTGVDAVSEMVAVLGAQRAYEANATVFDTGKRLIEKTLDVERT